MGKKQGIIGLNGSYIRYDQLIRFLKGLGCHNDEVLKITGLDSLSTFIFGTLGFAQTPKAEKESREKELKEAKLIRSKSANISKIIANIEDDFLRLKNLEARTNIMEEQEKRDENNSIEPAGATLDLIAENKKIIDFFELFLGRLKRDLGAYRELRGVIDYKTGNYRFNLRPRKNLHLDKQMTMTFELIEYFIRNGKKQKEAVSIATKITNKMFFDKATEESNARRYREYRSKK